MHAVKEFQILLLNTNDIIQHYSFICTLLNGSNIALNHKQFNKTSVICLLKVE